MRNTGVGAFYLAFDAAVAAILAAQGWSLARLARRDDRLDLPLRGCSCALAQGRRWALPLLWEFGVPAAIAALPARFKVGWKGMFLYGPTSAARWPGSAAWPHSPGSCGSPKPGGRCAGRPAPSKGSKRLAAAGQMTAGPGSGTLASSAPSRRFATLR